MKYSQIYIMSVAASGKSTFASEHKYFAGYKIVDFASKLPRRSTTTRIIQFASRAVPSLRRFLHSRNDVIAANESNYFARVFEFLSREHDPVVVLGRRTPDDLGDYKSAADVRFGMVLIPENDHKRNCARRSKRLHNSLPFFPHPTTEHDNMLKVRKVSADYAARHNIPVYESFSDAIIALGAVKQA